MGHHMKIIVFTPDGGDDGLLSSYFLLLLLLLSLFSFIICMIVSFRFVIYDI